MGIEQKLDLMMKMITETNSNVNEMRVELGAKIDKLEKDMNIVKKDVSVIKQDVTILKRDVSVIKTQTAYLTEQNHIVKEQLAKISEEVTGIKELKDKYEYLTKQVQLLQRGASN